MVYFRADNFSRLAGSDTTSISLSFCFWELSQRTDIMTKLQAELDEVMLDPRIIPDISVFQKLPYLNAFIKEGVLVLSSNEPSFSQGNS